MCSLRLLDQLRWYCLLFLFSPRLTILLCRITCPVGSFLKSLRSDQSLGLSLHSPNQNRFLAEHEHTLTITKTHHIETSAFSIDDDACVEVRKKAGKRDSGDHESCTTIWGKKFTLYFPRFRPTNWGLLFMKWKTIHNNTLVLLLQVQSI